MDGAVGECADEVQVSDDRPGLWAWWEVEFAATPEVGREEDKSHSC